MAGLTRRERRAREHRKKLEAARAALDSAARRQAAEALAADRRIFELDSKQAPYRWPARNRRRGARWPEEAA